ncbi:MAG TPA: hypothetical protein PK156_36790 [Polyangium sp.]|nr:hypothetical protein [Polyangium sp.]
MKDYLVDLAPNALKGARGPQPGHAEVLEELAHAMPSYGEAAEIHPSIYQRVVTSTTGIEKLRAKEAALSKLLEVVRESRGRLENNVEDDISTMGAQAEDKGTRGKEPALLAHFEKTIEYRSQIAKKAAATRKKGESGTPGSEGETGG